MNNLKNIDETIELIGQISYRNGFMSATLSDIQTVLDMNIPMKEKLERIEKLVRNTDEIRSKK